MRNLLPSVLSFLHRVLVTCKTCDRGHTIESFSRLPLLCRMLVEDGQVLSESRRCRCGEAVHLSVAAFLKRASSLDEVMP